MIKLLTILVTAAHVGAWTHANPTVNEEGRPSAPSLEHSIAAKASISPEGVGANGYDLVTMLKSQGEEIVTGRRDYAATHGGVTYYFTSAEHRRTFFDNPESYTPKYGGFCGWGMVDYRDTNDPDRPLNIPHAAPTPPSPTAAFTPYSAKVTTHASSVFTTGRYMSGFSSTRSFTNQRLT